MPWLNYILAFWVSLDSSELVQAEGPTVIENLHIALARAHATITPERILGLGALLLK